MLIDRALSTIKNSLRSSLEDPSTPLTSRNIFSVLGVESTSASGVAVTRDTALGHPAIYRGCQLIANDVAKLPLQRFEKTSENGRRPTPQHPQALLLRTMVNPFMKAHTFFKTLVGHALLHRGGYAIIRRNGAGMPLSLDVLDPEQTFPVFAQGELFYQTQIGRTDILLRAPDVFHIRGLGFDGLDGWSVLDKLKDALGLGLAAQKYGAVYFKNNAQPRVVIEFPGYLEDDQAIERFRNSWGNIHGGVDNAHRPAILEGGAKIEPFQISNEDSQFLELRQFDVRMVAAILGVPPHKLGDDTRTSHASLEQENQAYLDEAIDPWLREIETECNAKLLTPSEWRNDTAFYEFNRKALVRTNLNDRVNAYTSAIMNGWMSRGEVREKENLPPVDNLEEFLVPLNVGVVGQEQVEPEPPQQDESDDDSRLASVTLYECRRMVSRVVKWIEKASRDSGSFVDSLDELHDKHEHVWRDALTPLGASEDVYRILGDIRDQFLEMSGTCVASDLEEVARQHLRELEADIPARMAAMILDKE